MLDHMGLALVCETFDEYMIASGNDLYMMLFHPIRFIQELFAGIPDMLSVLPGLVGLVIFLPLIAMLLFKR